MNDAIDFVAFRAINSLLKCRAKDSSDAKFKVVTGTNIIKKIFNCMPIDVKIDFTSWPFDDTIVQVDFRGIEYDYVCPRNCDSNLFLNPYYHEYDVPLLLVAALQRGDNFVDVGAHCGLYTLLAGKIVGPTGKVIAIEPNPINRDLLKRNVNLNELNNVRIVPNAASDKRSLIEIYYERGKTAFTSASKRACSSMLVETTTLDEITESLDSIRMVKIDTEGYDLRVLKGASKTLSKTSFVIVEQISSDVQNLLSQFGFGSCVLTASRNLFASKKSIQLRSTSAMSSVRVEGFD